MAKINAREEEKQRRNQEKMARLSQWNLKDGWGLLRVLQESGLHLKYSNDSRPLSMSSVVGQCGIPTADSDSYSVDWARLLREIGVEKVKTESNVDDYYVDMINRCRRAVFLYGASASSGAVKGPGNSGKDAVSGGGEAAEFEDPDECNDADFVQSNNSAGAAAEDAAGSANADKKRSRKSKGALVDAPNPLELPKQSFRVLQRVQAISTVRRMIFRPSLSDEQRMLVIKSAPSCGVPGWTAEHDLALLTGINVHAFEWDNIRNDPALPFVPLDLESSVPHPEGKIALLKDYRAAQRIEQLCDLFVTEPWVQAKPIPLIKRPSHMARRSGGKRNRKKIRPNCPAAQGSASHVDGEDGDYQERNEEGEEEDNDANDDGADEERHAGGAGDDDDDDEEDEDGEEEEEEEEEGDDGNDDDDGEEGSDDDDDENEGEGGNKFSDPCDESEGSAGGEDMGGDD
jgi:hypothetical protein